jgi:hypothetical protein
MTQQPPQKLRKALGRVIAWTDAKLDEMSLISDLDKDAALKLWVNEAPKPLRRILQAGKEEQPK